MKVRDRVLIGLAGGAALAWGARALIRSSRKIDLKGRVVVVTGSSSGYGLLIAREAARRGAKLVLAARGEADLEAAARDLRSEGAEVLAVPTDVSVESQARNLIDRAVERFGRIDVLVNNAGIIQVGPVETMGVADFEEAMATNFWGEVYPTLAAIPHMKAQGGGRIANVVSLGGKRAVPHMLPYSASKFALAGFTEGLRSELVKDNILVTGIYPGTIRTGGHAHAKFKGDRHSEYTWFALSDIIPGVAASAESGAKILWDAVTHGDPEALVGWTAHAMRLAHGLFPNWTAEAFALLNRALPQGEETAGGALRGDQLEGTIPGALNRFAPPGTRPRAV